MLTESDQQALLKIAQTSLNAAARGERLPMVQLEDLSECLREVGATFVTLHLGGRLRGCLGSLSTSQMLAQNVAENAYRAALEDPRFTPVTKAELPDVTIHISVLSPMEPMDVQSLEDLREQLQPGVDGLLIEAGERRGTFLPDVWDQLPNMDEFLDQLWRKARLAPGEWPNNMAVFRYSTSAF